MSVDSPSVVLVSHRLISEQLQALMALLAERGDQLPAEAVAVLARVVTGVSALCDGHDVDTRGRCKRCRPARRPWPRRRAMCTVHAVVEPALRCSAGVRHTEDLSR